MSKKVQTTQLMDVTMDTQNTYQQLRIDHMLGTLHQRPRANVTANPSAAAAFAAAAASAAAASSAAAAASAAAGPRPTAPAGATVVTRGVTTARHRQEAQIKQFLHIVFTGRRPETPSRRLDERVHAAFAAVEGLRMRARRLARRRIEPPREVFMCIHGFSSAEQHSALFDVLRHATSSRCLFGSMVRIEPGQTSGGWEMIASVLVEDSRDRRDAERSEEVDIAALEGLCDTFGMSVGIEAFEHYMDSRMVTSLERIAAGRCRLGRLATAKTRGGEALEARFQQERERHAEARAVQELEAITGAPFTARNMLEYIEDSMIWEMM